MALGFRFHVVDTTFKRFETGHRFIQLAAVQLATHVAGRACSLVAQRQRLLTCTGFAEFVFKLTNLFLHTRQSIIHQRHFVFQRGNHVGQLLLLNQRSASQIFFYLYAAPVPLFPAIR
ncbi:hypothetical protein HR12_30735 [Microbacterium sp. SUBG005]|nr:hypothetical protein HR12_30735 [Microbacterium sp. SUBG005]